MRTVSIGRQSFERLVRTNHFYVDKTAFIKEWLENDDEVTAITRPRRFGKTLNMDMMHCFFSPKYEGQQDLFSGLFISSYPEIMKLQGTVPVISLSFLGVRGVTRVDFLLAMHETIAKLYDEHSYLLDSDVLDENDREQFKQIMKKGAQIPPKSDEEAYSAYLMQIKMSLQYLSGWLHKYYEKR